MEKINSYTSMMSKNHLIEEIQSYDAKVKEMDKALVAKDSDILSSGKSMSGKDEHLTDNEMKNIFKQ